MTDLHSHILPGIDDGARDTECARLLLRREYEQGVRRVALTSHYDCEKLLPEEFLARRGEAYARLRDGLEAADMDMTLKLGSEVRFSPALTEMELRGLCLEGTSVLLLELPVAHRPPFLSEVLHRLSSRGIIPLIAHVERYPYVLEDPTLLAKWMELEAYTQINADTLLRDDRLGRMALRFLEWGLVQVVASDAHSLEKRPPRLAQAMDKIEKKLGSRMVRHLRENADGLFDGMEPQVNIEHYPRKFIGRWI